MLISPDLMTVIQMIAIIFVAAIILGWLFSIGRKVISIVFSLAVAGYIVFQYGPQIAGLIFR